MDEDDPYAFMIEPCEIPSEQQDLLRCCPFVENRSDLDRDEPWPTSGLIQEASAGIVMSSIPETQDDEQDNSGPQDIFHAPPEKPSLPTSDDQPNPPSVFRCAVSKVVETNGDTIGLVDFSGADSELWFSEAAAECSRRTELSLKDGLASSELSMGVTIEGNACGESSAKKSLGSGENLGAQVVQPEIERSTGNFNFHDGDVEKCVGNGESSEPPHTAEVNETSERQNRIGDPPRERVLPSIFDVLNVVGGDPEENSLADVSLVEIAKRRGMTFPSPRWWPNNSVC